MKKPLRTVLTGFSKLLILGVGWLILDSAIDAGAATYDTFYGGVDGYWSTDANWSTFQGAYPSSVFFCGLVFGSQGTSRLTNTNDLPGKLFDGLIIYNSGYDLRGYDFGIYSYVHAEYPSGYALVEPGLNFNYNGTQIRVLNPATTLWLSGPVTVNNASIIVTNKGLLYATGPWSSSGNAVVNFQGPGVVELGADNNPFAGAMNVAGSLDVFTSLSNAQVTVTGTLLGSGSIGRVSLTGGHLTPGETFVPGRMTVLSNFTADASSTLTFRATGTTPGIDYDQLRLSGSNSAASLGICQLQFLPTFQPAPGQSFTLIDKVGTNKVTGTFAGWPEGAKQFLGNAFYQITYAGGDGNDVVITATNLTAIWKGGAATPAWSLASNWSNNIVPTTNYDVQFPPVPLSTTTSNDLAGVPFNRLIFLGSNYVLRGSSLPLKSGILFSNGGGSQFIYAGVTALADISISNLFFCSVQISNVVPGNNSVHFGGGLMSVLGIGAGNGTVSYDPGISSLFAIYGPVTHTGPVLVRGGSFFVNGDCSSESVMVVSNTASKGSGKSTTLALSDPSSYLQPGNASSPLTIGGTLLLTNGTFSTGIYGGPNPPPGNFSFYRLSANGPIIITTNCQLFVDIQYSPTNGDTYVFMTNSGPVPPSGYFSGLPEGAALPLSNQLFRVSYRGGDGDDFTLTTIPFPHIWNAIGPSQLWSSAANWISNSAPGAGDGMIFPNFITTLAPTNDFPSFTRFESLVVSNNYTFYGNPVELTGGFRVDGSATFNPAVRVAAGQVWNVRSNFFVNGPLDLTTNLVSFFGGGNVVFSNNITGTSGSLLSLGALNSLTLNGTNSFSGTLRIFGGTLTNNGLQFNSPVRVDQADWFVNSVALLSNTAVAFSGGVSNNAFVSGRIINGSLAITGGVFTVTSGGVVSNCLVTLSNGTLTAFGQMPSSPITMLGGTLSGTGTVASVTASGGTISPGASPGRLRTGNLLLAPGVTMDMQIAGSSAGATYDQLQVTGSVNLANAMLHLSLVDETLNIGDVVTLIDNDGADVITGTFAGLPENTTFPLGLLDVRISYVGGTGNDVTLTVLNKIPRATWTGLGSTNDWATATNWARSTLPLDGDNLYFPSLATNLANINSLGSSSYATIFFGGSNYVIQAAGVALTGGIIATNPVGTNWVDSVLPTVTSVISNTAGNTLVFTGDLHDSFLNFNTAGNAEIRAQLAGGSNVVMNGSGTLRLFSTNAAFHGNFILQRGLTEGDATNAFGSGGGKSISISSAATLLFNNAGEFQHSFYMGGTQHVAVVGSVLVDGGTILTASNATYVVDAGASLTLAGSVAGAYGFDKEGAGEMTLSVTNFYTGPTFVNGGTLYMSGLPTNAPAPSITVNHGSLLRGGGPVGPIFVNQGTLAPGYNDSHAAFLPHDGVSLGSQSTYRVRLSNVSAGTYDSMSVAGPVVLASPQLQLVMDFRPPVGASFTLIENDGTDVVFGTFAGLSQNSFYTNGPTVFRVLYNAGTGNDVAVVADHYLSTGITRTWTGAGTNAFWSNPQNWATNIAPQSGDALYFPPGALQLTNQNDFTSNTFFHAITIGGANYRLAGNLIDVLGGVSSTNASGLNTIALPLAILTNMTFRCQASQARLAFEGSVDNNSRRLLLGGSGTILGIGPVIGLGDLEQAGPGIVELRGTNSYTGETKVSGGRLRFQSSPLGRSGGAVTITNSAILELSATTNVTKDFTICGTVLFTNAPLFNVQGAFDFPTGCGGTFHIAAGTLATISASFLRDGGAPIKEGPGDLYWSVGDIRQDAYTGSALINAGRVIFDSQTKGVTADFGTFIVNNGGTLAATGQVNRVVVNNGGKFAPGLFSGVGPVDIQGGLSFAPGGILAVDLQGVLPIFDFDTLSVKGSVNLSNATLQVSLGYNAVTFSEYQIINNDGIDPVIGQFAGVPEGGLLTTADGTYRISYLAGDGNDISLMLVTSSQPAITSFSTLPNGSKQIIASGEPGSFILFEATASLAPPISWTLLDVQIPNGSGIVTFIDSDATNHPVRFYRISAP